MQYTCKNGDVIHISKTPIFNGEGKVVAMRTCTTTFYYGCPLGECQSDTDCIDHTYREGDDAYETDVS